jgi:uncharacterized protein YpuA (DUF1002 family)
MGKKEKEHRAKVAKRNKRIGQEKYKMQNALNKLMEQIAKQQDAEETEKSLNVSVGGSEVPFSVVTEDELNSIVEFKEDNQEMFQVEAPEISVQDELSEVKNELEEEG